MSRKLYKSLKAQKDQTEQVKLTIYGSLGIPLGGRKVIQVDGRQGYVYVRLRDNQNEVIQAFNNKVAASYDLPVILVREGGRYVVQQFNSQRYLNNSQNSAPFLPGHGTQHSFPRGGGADITWVYGQQIIPGLVYPESATGTNVMIEKYPLYSSSGWIYAGGTGTQNILQYRPTTGSSSLMALVYLDSITGNPGILVGSGTYFPAVITGSVYPYLPSPSSTQIPLAGVLLNTGTTVITWENLYDVRQWIHATPSGTSSGGGGGIDTIGFAGLSNGVPIGTGTFLNVQGATFTRSGTMFNLNIPASTVYDNFWNSGTAGVHSLRVKNNTTTDAVGEYAVAEGQDNFAFAPYSHAEGRRTSAIGTGSHAEGYLTTAYGNHSHAEGYQTFVSGTTSFVSGDGNHNIGNQSAILGGLNNRLTGDRSVLLGGFSRTGTANDTVYVPKLNIQTVQAGSPLTLLGVDNQGMVVSGTFPSEQIGVYGLYKGAGLGTGTSLNLTTAAGAEPVLSISGTTLQLNIPATGTYGTWTPTAFSGTNTQTIVPNLCHYLVVGNEVMFHGSVQIDTGAIGAFTCYLSIPIASNFNANTDANGNGTQPGTGVPNILSIREDQTNDRLQLDGYAQVNTNLFYRLAGGYIIK